MPLGTDNTTVLTFGTFDPLHAGHHDMFRQARGHGNRLVVVVARDSAVLLQKGHETFIPQAGRLAAVAHDPLVDEAMLGDEDPTSYAIFHRIPFDILALGYDQSPADEEARRMVDAAGHTHARIIRLVPYKADTYKSSLLKPS